MLMSSSVARVTYFSIRVSTCNMYIKYFYKISKLKIQFLIISHNQILVYEIIIILSMQKLFFTIVFYITNIWIAIKNEYADP